MLLQASELEDLEDEANMPLEQLMAKYGYTANTHAATPSHPSSTPPVNAHSDTSPTPAGPSSDPSSPTPPPHASPQSLAKPMSSGSKAEVPADSLMDAAQPTAAAKGEDVQAMQLQQQAEQATAAGMDAFEHSQALAERRASGSQAGPSSPSAPAPGELMQPVGMTVVTAATRPFLPLRQAVPALCGIWLIWPGQLSLYKGELTSTGSWSPVWKTVLHAHTTHCWRPAASHSCSMQCTQAGSV